jgi:hypothetical protein
MESIPLCLWNIQKQTVYCRSNSTTPKDHHRARWLSLKAETSSCILNKLTCIGLIVKDMFLNEISLLFIELYVADILPSILYLLCIT